jgi:hypothetical protein
MADLIFLIAGIVLFIKKEVRISRKRILSGRPVKILAVLYILPFVIGSILGFIAGANGIDLGTVFWITVPFNGTDFSVVLFRPNFTLVSEDHLMKMHKKSMAFNLLSPLISLGEP